MVGWVMDTYNRGLMICYQFAWIEFDRKRNRLAQEYPGLLDTSVRGSDPESGFQSCRSKYLLGVWLGVIAAILVALIVLVLAAFIAVARTDGLV